jgi:hypothetical protein
MSGEVFLKPVAKDSAVLIDDIESLYSKDEQLKQSIYSRGLSTNERF